jgi:hypothetical protein
MWNVICYNNMIPEKGYKIVFVGHNSLRMIRERPMSILQKPTSKKGYSFCFILKFGKLSSTSFSKILRKIHNLAWDPAEIFVLWKGQHA